MAGQQQEAELLDFIARGAGCTYLSDLRQSRYIKKIKQVLENMDVEQFDIRQWNNAVSYLGESPMEFETPQQAVTYLIRML